MYDNGLDLEMQVLGTFLKDSEAQVYIENLTEKDFSGAVTKNIFKAMHKLRRRNKTIDIYSLVELTGLKVTEITKITESVAGITNIEQEVKLLKERTNKKALQKSAAEMMKLLKNKEKSAAEIQGFIINELQSLLLASDGEVSPIDEGMANMLQLLEDRYKNKDDKSYYTGIGKLDSVTGGLHPQELTTIASRPGVGKTMIGMQIGLNVASNGRKVMFTSLEMAEDQIMQRIITANTNIDSLRMRTGDLKDDEWADVMRVVGEYETKNWFTDNHSRTVNDIIAKIRKHNPDLVIVDYLQLLSSDERGLQREREVANMSRQLKLASLEFKIPIIILSQLNRAAEGGRPNMRNLRESGAIEQDSDNIFFLHEPEGLELKEMIENKGYTYQFIEGLQRKGQKLSQLIVGKQRNGAVGTIDVIKVPRLMKFLEIDVDRGIN